MTQTQFDPPGHVPPSALLPWDHYDEATLREDPVGCYDPLRSSHRAFYSPRYGGFWVLTRYEDVREVLQNPDEWSNVNSSIPPRPNRLLPVNLDPPEHTKYRKIINGPFSPGSVRGLEDGMRDVTRSLLDPIEPGVEFDFIEDFAKPFPAAIFCNLFGLPAEKLPDFMTWTDLLLHSSDMEARSKATAELREYLRTLVCERQTRPQADLLTDLMQAEVDGAQLTEDELLDFAHTLFTAGLDTVTTALAFTFRRLGADTELRRRLQSDRDLIPGAVEEFLRHNGFVQLTRTATRDTSIAGVLIKKGELVLLPLASTGRDEEAFERADGVDFERHPNRHLAFGAGPHRCVGSHLARLELRVAIEEWHDRFPDYVTIAPSHPVGHGGGVAGLDEVRMRIEAP